ncbi:hypothetical protein BH09PLA1_BH09PLA1_08490 [soil metagenome]
MNRAVAILIMSGPVELERARKGLPRCASRILGATGWNSDALSADVHRFELSGARSGPVVGQSVHAQRGHDFGERLENAVDELSAAGYERLVIVGTDCPQLEQADLARAIDLLQTNRLVLGPDHRGGCWLIGLHTRDRRLLAEITWQRNTDFRALCDRIEPHSLAILETKFDIDSPDDLIALARADRRFAALAEPSIVTSGHRNPLVARLANLRLTWQLPPPAQLRHSFSV